MLRNTNRTLSDYSIKILPWIASIAVHAIILYPILGSNHRQPNSSIPYHPAREKYIKVTLVDPLAFNPEVELADTTSSDRPEAEIADIGNARPNLNLLFLEQLREYEDFFKSVPPQVDDATRQSLNASLDTLLERQHQAVIQAVGKQEWDRMPQSCKLNLSERKEMGRERLEDQITLNHRMMHNRISREATKLYDIISQGESADEFFTHTFKPGERNQMTYCDLFLAYYQEFLRDQLHPYNVGLILKENEGKHIGDLTVEFRADGRFSLNDFTMNPQFNDPTGVVEAHERELFERIPQPFVSPGKASISAPFTAGYRRLNSMLGWLYSIAEHKYMQDNAKE